jgi:DNA-binding NtrC family response regulator
MNGPSAEAVTSQRRILVIEDEMLIGMLLEDMLADMGHVVVGTIPRLNEALTAVQRDDFDLAILDVHLNGQSVFPVAEALSTRGLPFVFVTGYGQSGLPDHYRDRPVLQKPFARDDLERMLLTVPAV